MATKKTFLTIDDYRASGLYKDEANDTALEKLLMIASQKIDMVADLGLDAFDSPNMTQDQQDALKEATSIVVDHWNSGGWDWKKSSGSASISSLSASISRMDNNDIVPQIALDILQRASLYDPFETIGTCGGFNDVIADYPTSGGTSGGVVVNPNQGFTQAQLTYLINNYVPAYGLNGKQDKLPISPGGSNTKDYVYINKHGVIQIETLEDVLRRNGWLPTTAPGGGSTGGGTTTTVAGLPWLTDNYADLTDFGNHAKENEIVKYDTNTDGTPNSQSIQLIAKVAGGLKQIKTWEEIKPFIDAVKADVAANTTAITAANTKIDGVDSKTNKNTADIAQLAAEIQYIENTWTGDRLMPSNGTSDLSAIQGDKGAFDFTAGKKLIITVGAMGKAITDTKVLKVGTSGSYHLVGEGVDATFGVTVADTGVLTIQNFASTGSTSIDMHHLLIKSIEQNPKSTAVIDAYTKQETDNLLLTKANVGASYTKAEGDGKYATKTELSNIPAPVDAYTKAESDARYEHASLDFTASPLTWTESSQGGHNYIILDRPAAAGTTVVGGLNKIKIQAPASPLTHADAQVTYATDLIFINKAAGNIMTYDEITTEVAAGKTMVIKKIAQGEWELVRWENPGVELTETLRVVFKSGKHKDFKTGGV